MKLVAQLDRYHGLAGHAPLASAARPLGLPPRAPAPLASTHAPPSPATEADRPGLALKESSSTREIES